jgi:HAD superfamily hydrolase (TIGR01509 family)
MPVMRSLKQGSRRLPEGEIDVGAVFLDALGTLIQLEPPWVHLAAALGEQADDRLMRAVRAEMAFYKANSHMGRDADSLAELRARCAAVLSQELGREVDADTMMGAIRFHAYPDSAPSLAALRRRGLSLVCVSNWDCSLPDVLEGCGLGEALDGVVTSAEAGARKPDPDIFAPALAIAGVTASRALHVGDTVAEDVDGARAAGIRALHLDRSGAGEITSLAEVAARLDTMP